MLVKKVITRNLAVKGDEDINKNSDGCLVV